MKRVKADLRDEHVDLGLARVVAKISEDVPQLGATDAAGAIEVEHPKFESNEMTGFSAFLQLTKILVAKAFARMKLILHFYSELKHRKNTMSTKNNFLGPDSAFETNFKNSLSSL